MANSTDPDQTPRTAASDLVLHCLLYAVCPNAQAIYGNIRTTIVLDVVNICSCLESKLVNCVHLSSYM